MKTIVVGYDGGEGADRVVERSTELARALGARLVAVSATELVAAAVAATPIHSAYVPMDLEAQEEMRRRAEAALDRVKGVAERAGVECETRVVTGGPVDSILTVADETEADMIVVGTHERGFLERLLEGSVSQAVARNAHCDVLIVHPGA